ncbi:MAG: hypothetical protein WA982_02840 [Rubrobacteraceae bacterium]
MMFGRLFREPQGGQPYPTMIFIGCAVLLVGTLMFIFASGELSQRLIFLGQAAGGLGFISLGAAELLPKPRIKIAALMRFLAFMWFALSIGAILVTLWQTFG